MTPTLSELDLPQNTANHYMNQLMCCFSLTQAQNVWQDMSRQKVDPNAMIKNCSAQLFQEPTRFSSPLFSTNFLNTYFALYHRLFQLEDSTLLYLMERTNLNSGYCLYALLKTAFIYRKMPFLCQSNLDYLIDNTHSRLEEIEKTFPLEAVSVNENLIKSPAAMYFKSFEYLQQGTVPLCLTQDQIGKLIDKSNLRLECKYELTILSSMNNIFSHISLNKVNLSKIASGIKVNKRSLHKFVTSAVLLLQSKSVGVLDLLNEIEKIHHFDWVKAVIEDHKNTQKFNLAFAFFPLQTQSFLILERKIPLTKPLISALEVSAQGQSLLEKRHLSDEVHSCLQAPAKSTKVKL